MYPSEAQVTELLLRWRSGDRNAADDLATVVYNELRRIAAGYMRSERAEHTLEPTAVVNELYLHLFQSSRVDWQDRAHFFAVAARQLRRILINYARDRVAAKRGGEHVRITITSLDDLSGPRQKDLLDLNQALERLEEFDERAARAMELRFFAGLTEAEASEALGVSVATLKRDLAFARAWVVSQLQP